MSPVPFGPTDNWSAGACEPRVIYAVIRRSVNRANANGMLSPPMATASLIEATANIISTVCGRKEPRWDRADVFGRGHTQSGARL